MSKRVLLLTGAPGIGKTTVLSKAVEALQAEGVRVGGMISCEARESGVRVGFEILDLAGGRHGWLARVDLKVGPPVGKYHVCLPDLDSIGAAAIVEAIEQSDVIAIDEIGPMELYSREFKQAVEKALGTGKPLLAVVYAKAKDPLIEAAKQREDAEVFVVTETNRESMPQTLKMRALEALG